MTGVYTDFRKIYGHLQDSVSRDDYFLTGWSYAFGARLPQWLEYDMDGAVFATQADLTLFPTYLWLKELLPLVKKKFLVGLGGGVFDEDDGENAIDGEGDKPYDLFEGRPTTKLWFESCERLFMKNCGRDVENVVYDLHEFCVDNFIKSGGVAKNIATLEA